MDHPRATFDQELEDLRRSALEMGAFVSGMLDDALKSLFDRNTDLANELRERDALADEMDEAIESRATRLLALQQPVAGDLRVVTASLKVVTDLERMGDYAVAVARTTLALASEPPAECPPAMREISRLAQTIVRESLQAFEAGDVEFARRVRQGDKAIDRLWHELEADLVSWMTREPARAPQAARYLLVARYLERIGDHAKNVCERVAYMVTGRRKPWRTSSQPGAGPAPDPPAAHREAEGG
ncbi:MAG TPA: phosphate signaling complex protein PhoU [Armatimonadota bacterium]|nr:phosphate signaling complex protein PhoU [Armatimonadota bacterium]